MQLIQGQCKRQSRKVEKSDIARVKKEAKEMIVLCNLPLGRFPRAFAIAHCQVDHTDPLRFFVLIDGRVIMNPRIERRSEDFLRETEGCYSYPFRNEVSIKRHKSVWVAYDEIVKSKIVAKSDVFTELMSRIFQHEIDHMNGKAIYS